MTTKTSKKKKSSKQKRSYAMLVIAFWVLILLGVAGAGLFMSAVSKGALGPLPTFKQLENPDNPLASEVYTADNVLLGKYYSENRSNAHYEDLPDVLVNALLATEDIRYHKHAGIDVRGLTRAVVNFGQSGGASTITQQLAKNLFHDRAGNTWERIKQKLKEIVIAVQLERYYTKEEIMAMYLNTVEFSHNAFGIKSAARTYFNKPVDSLNVQEAAVLVGMLKAPTALNPKSNYENSVARRNLVLYQMERYGYLTGVEKDSLQALPIELQFRRSDHIEGLAPYFREYLRLELQQWCRENVKVDGSNYNLYQDGLRIYTTLDSRMQELAEAAVAEHLSEFQPIFFDHWKGKDPWKEYPQELKRVIKDSERYQALRASGMTEDSINIVLNTPVRMTIFTWQGEKDTVMSPLDSLKYHRMFLQTGFMVADPKTGQIKAWVGGINYKYFKYDHVNPNTKRQIGSTFKPFVYTEAIDNGWSPCFEVVDMPVTFEDFDNWTPKNAAGGYSGDKYTLQRGMAESKNSVTAYLMKQIGPQPVIDRVRKMGITSPIDPYPSICLGTPDISVFEMVGAYTTYANNGVYSKPIFISRIEDSNGNLIQEFPAEKVEVLNEQTAYVMVEMLKNVLKYKKGEFEGTAARIRGRHKLYNEIGAKTGTTQNQSDGWFMGITPELVGGAWVGCEDRFVRFSSLTYGQGSRMALPIWGKFFEKVYADSTLGIDPAAKFERPRQPLTIELDCSKYKKDNEPGYQQNTYGSQFETGSVQ